MAPSRHPLVRRLWIAAGWTSLGLGILGAFLPLLPTTPFVLLAAFCFARGSRRLHTWLMEHRWLGAPLRRWRHDRTISVKTKWTLTAMYGLAIPVAVWFAPFWWLKVLLGVGVVGALVGLWLWPSARRRSSPEKAHADEAGLSEAARG
jgi:uncharacterized protein